MSRVDEIKKIVDGVLKHYNCQHTKDENGEGLPLIDVLSPHETIKEGREEIEYIGDDLIQALADSEAERVKGLVEVFYKEVCATNLFYYPDEICRNQPPEISNFMNGCLSCPIRETCQAIKKVAEGSGECSECGASVKENRRHWVKCPNRGGKG